MLFAVAQYPVVADSLWCSTHLLLPQTEVVLLHAGSVLLL